MDMNFESTCVVWVGPPLSKVLYEDSSRSLSSIDAFFANALFLSVCVSTLRGFSEACCFVFEKQGANVMSAL